MFCNYTVALFEITIRNDASLMYTDCLYERSAHSQVMTMERNICSTQISKAQFLYICVEHIGQGNRFYHPIKWILFL